MPPYSLPEFHMPYIARLNPHLAAARQHSIEWAHDMGMIGSPGAIWTQHDLDSHDYPLLCAYAHPDASGPELELVTDWYVWVFYFDDYFLAAFKHTGDMAGAADHLARLSAFMPLDGRPAAVAHTSVERGLADLWTRTVPGTSRRWRERFAQTTRELLDESLTELANRAQQRTPNPLEYIELRRKVGGAPWSAALAEHAANAELPPALAASRPLRVITDTFADGVHLRNDLFSYQRELDQEGELNNCVWVTQQFFDCDPQQAADLVNDLLTSRMQLFEQTVASELPALMRQHDELLPAERERVHRYVQALRDWQSGGHEWHRRSSRYMNAATRHLPPPQAAIGVHAGYGTAAARLLPPPTAPHPRRRPGRTARVYGAMPSLPPLPFALHTNPHLDHARDASLSWARRLGLLDPVPGVAGSDIWTEDALRGFDFALCAAAMHPSASAEQLELSTEWLIWPTWIDDGFPSMFRHPRDEPAARAFLDRLYQFMPLDGGQVPACTNPAERGLADTWARAIVDMPTPDRQRFRQAVVRWLDSHLWEFMHNSTGQVPDPVDYMEMRRLTFGADMTMTLSRIDLGTRIPDDVYHSGVVRELEIAAQDYACLLNDLCSYDKELHVEGETLNGVLVIQRFLDCDTPRAMEATAELMRARLRQFRHIVNHDLPALVHRLHLDSEARDGLAQLVTDLQNWMTGIHHWHVTCNRYWPDAVHARGGHLRRQRLSRPAGLGTAAAHVRPPGGGHRLATAHTEGGSS
ncbi:germacradienol/geosmin synthase [Actinobacteria bacterium YIM 96077]|uniref:Terpene synthase n=1 Tax=Phytoactinopolyspora halophila TaxID=1981511 RepID=A0A329R399_9ACTN|nr:germacradienol/geosmin synthase [Phytoactinopolyspora halophila]AYY11903.1 germacradienol/geosmin synthase [Actinobacteria bacterium YIM 96077]RAW18863.1 germacradienol/geosmin synthase [Phytoactinopolyspora halophila]